MRKTRVADFTPAFVPPPFDLTDREFPGRALVSVEAGVDPALAAAVIERLAR